MRIGKRLFRLFYYFVILVVIYWGFANFIAPFLGFPTHYGWRCFTALSMMNAVSRGDKKSVESIVRRHPDMINCKHYSFKGQKSTVLCDAIIGGHTNIALFLIDHGANVNERSFPYETPINKATIEGNDQVVKSLISHGADISAPKDGHLHSPLSNAIGYKRWKICSLLRQAGANDIPLAIEIITRGDNQLLKEEIKRNPTILQSDGYNIVCCAIHNKRIDCIKTLADSGVDINAYNPGKDKKPLFAIACEEGNMAVIKTLVECGAKIEWSGVDNKKRNGLCYAVNSNNPEIVTYLLNMGLNPNTTRPAITDALLYNDAAVSYKMTIILQSKGFCPDKETLQQYDKYESSRATIETYLWKFAK